MQHRSVGVVGAGDHQRIAQATLQQVGMVLEQPGPPTVDQRGGRITAAGMRVGDGRHLGAAHRMQVEQVFTPHAAAADDAVTNLVFHVVLSPSGRPG